jgi:salicylate hydroxylase
MREPILIAGAGIGGLAAAVGLAARGHEVGVLEQRDLLGEVGAGVQLGPNAVKALQSLGVDRQLSAAVVAPSGIDIFAASAAEPLARLPLDDAVARFGAPYWTVHRHDLHACLLAAAQRSPRIALTLGFKLAGAKDLGGAVTVRSLAGETARGRVLIGADGLWSTVRHEIDAAVEVAFAGKTAWRATLPMAQVPAAISRRSVGLWLGPEAHLVHYPVRGGDELNVVAVIDEAWHDAGWDFAADAGLLVGRFASWAKPARDLLGAVGQWRKWALYRQPPLARWHRGRLALLGDAAHPVLPFLAQGAALALEDAVVLASCLGDPASDLSGLADYARRRRSRAERVQRQSLRNGTLFHLSGSMQRLRDATLRLTPGPMLLGRYRWLYGYSPVEEP